VKKIRKGQSATEVAVAISDGLKEAGVSAVLSGGGAVSIYSDNEYESTDLDFVTLAGFSDLSPVMERLGFARKGRHFKHRHCEWLIEFPPGPLMLGDEIAMGWAEKRTVAGVIRMLTPLSPIPCLPTRVESCP